MKKIFISIGLLLLLTVNVSAARFGSGQIEIDQSFRDHFQGYLVEIKSSPDYVFVFTANHEGDSWWYAWSFGNWQKATEESLKGCNKLAKKNGHSKCRVLAKGSKIFWKWDQLEDELYKNKKNIISPNDVRAVVGSGDVSLAINVENNYQDALEKMNNFDDSSRDYLFYFAVSNDGKKYGHSSGNTGKNATRKKQLEDDLKNSAIARCMTKNIGKQCYLYASHEGILWKF
ncbi:hypothetical protein N8Y98_04855 [Pelagibacterales bacterium]|jgi:hypothetical protein|nr:hypothetical protein [Pelagibacterales bacterium]